MWISLVFALLLLGASPAEATEECAPADAIEAFEAGQQLIQTGDIEGAIARLEQAVAIYPDFKEAYESLEWQYRQVGDYAKAIEAAEQQIRLVPGMAELHEYGIQMYRRLMATPESAMEALARSSLYEQGSAEAIAACREAIEIHPTFLEAHTDLTQHYIRADDEANAKKQLAEVVALDAQGAGPVLVDVMAHLKPEWLTEEYGEELSAVFARHLPEDDETPEPPDDYPAFSAEEVAAILSAYAEQVAAIRTLIDEHDDMGAAKDKYTASSALQEKLRFLSFVSLNAESGGPGEPPWYSHEFFDAEQDFMKKNRMDFRPFCWTGRIARNLDVPGKRHADWRVGLCQVWIERRYCRLRCVAALEFRIDTEIEGRTYRIKALVDDVAGIMQCPDQFGDSPMSEW